MSRNNEDRTGTHSIHSEPPPQVVQEQLANFNQSNSLAFVVPTEFVELPSRGSLYSKDHPLHGQKCVEIKHMTAKEEDILSDRALLKKGLAIDRFLRSIIIDKSINIDSLLVGDKNSILVAARINGYGAEYDTKVICPVCFSHGRHTFDLEKQETTNSVNLEELGAEQTKQGTFVFGLPKSGVEVECKVFTGVEEKRLTRSAEKRKKQKLPARDFTAQLRTIIISVDGNEESSFINSFVENMPAADSRHLRSTYQKCVPNVELKDAFTCDECGAETELEVPFTTDFFWPNT
jgi:hypothetical protein